MSKLVGIINGREQRKIYDNDPQLLKWQCNTDFVPVWDVDYSGMGQSRCDHCGRTNKGREDCQSCGAPLS